jgi:hypothetical protein
MKHAFPINISLGWKRLTRTNTLSYNEHLQITEGKSFRTLGPGVNVIQLLKSVIWDVHNKI